MKRQFQNWTLLVVLGITLMAGASNAFAGKGFSVGGFSVGGSRGGSSNSSSSRSFNGGSFNNSSSNRTINSGSFNNRLPSSVRTQTINGNSFGSKVSGNSVTRNITQGVTRNITQGVTRQITNQPSLNGIKQTLPNTIRQIGGNSPLSNVTRQITGGQTKNVPTQKFNGQTILNNLPGNVGKIVTQNGSRGGQPGKIDSGKFTGIVDFGKKGGGKVDLGKVLGGIAIGVGNHNGGNNNGGKNVIGIGVDNHGIVNNCKKYDNWHCKHVVDLLVHKCWHKPQPHCVDPIWVEVGCIPAVETVAAPQPVGDLELLNVELAADVTPQNGPVYAVTFRNNSPAAIEHFRISLVAVWGEIDETSPTVTIDVTAIGPGESAVAQIELPPTAMAMGPQANLPFDMLVVAIDSFDELPEANEVNNVAMLKRDEITIVEVPAAAAQDGAVSAVQPVETTPIIEPAPAATQQVAAPVVVATPTETVAPADLNPNALDLVDIGGVAVRVD